MLPPSMTSAKEDLIGTKMLSKLCASALPSLSGNYQDVWQQQATKVEPARLRSLRAKGGGSVQGPHLRGWCGRGAVRRDQSGAIVCL